MMGLVRLTCQDISISIIKACHPDSTMICQSWYMTLLIIHCNCVLTEVESEIFANMGMASGYLPIQMQHISPRDFYTKKATEMMTATVEGDPGRCQAPRMIVLINKMTEASVHLGHLHPLHIQRHRCFMTEAGVCHFAQHHLLVLRHSYHCMTK
jgi:hypothetical protein